MAILLRAVGLVSLLTAGTWLSVRRVRRMRRGLPGLGLNELSMLRN